jgi:two-component sensor histidine kinase
MPEGVTCSDSGRRGAGAHLPAARPAAAPTDTFGIVITWPLDGRRPEAIARRVVISVLAELGVDPTRRDDAELAIQELVVNARRHAPGPYEVRIRVARRAVTLEVADGGGDHAAIARRLADPAATAPGCAEDGRGLQIVAALFPGACGAGPAGTGAGRPGKQVWIRVAVAASRTSTR